MIFLYFIPAATPDNFRESAAFKSGGLSLVFADCLSEVSFTETKGPGNVPGLIVAALPADGEKPFPIRYQPDSQEWWNSGDYWTGFSKIIPPTPAGIERKKPVPSYRYTLADGNVWKCPRIRRGVLPLVPHWYKIRSGQITYEIREEFQDIWEQSAEWTTDGTISVVDALSAASQCLSLNYRGTLEEFSSMRAFDESSIQDVLKAALDEEFFLEMILANQKKNSLT